MKADHVHAARRDGGYQAAQEVQGLHDELALTAEGGLAQLQAHFAAVGQ